MNPARVGRRQRGVGLIEVLVAVLLISVGFLAAAKMQVSGLRASQSAFYQTQAYFLVIEMMDRMRSNVEGVEQGAYDALATSATTSDPGCAGRSCSASEAALQDLHDWRARLHPPEDESDFAPVLPESDTGPPLGTVVRLDDGLYRISLSWSELIDGEASRQTLSMNLVTESN